MGIGPVLRADIFERRLGASMAQQNHQNSRPPCTPCNDSRESAGRTCTASGFFLETASMKHAREYQIRPNPARVLNCMTGRNEKGFTVHHVPSNTQLPGIWTRKVALNIAYASNNPHSPFRNIRSPK